jgi:hypothetical protein
MRLLVLYLRSRSLPLAAATAAGSVAALWSIDRATDHRVAGMLALLAVLAATLAVGPGLAGPDADLDRTASIPWPPRRAAHLVAAGAAVTGMVAATWLTGEQLAPAAQVVRDAIGMTGLIALGAATLGASQAWIPPLSWTLLSWTVMALPWPSSPTSRQVLTWMLQPTDTTPATVTALLLGAIGLLAYAVHGPAHDHRLV